MIAQSQSVADATKLLLHKEKDLNIAFKILRILHDSTVTYEQVKQILNYIDVVVENSGIVRISEFEDKKDNNTTQAIVPEELKKALNSATLKDLVCSFILEHNKNKEKPVVPPVPTDYRVL